MTDDGLQETIQGLLAAGAVTFSGGDGFVGSSPDVVTPTPAVEELNVGNDEDRDEDEHPRQPRRPERADETGITSIPRLRSSRIDGFTGDRLFLTMGSDEEEELQHLANAVAALTGSQFNLLGLQITVKDRPEGGQIVNSRSTVLEDIRTALLLVSGQLVSMEERLTRLEKGDEPPSST